MVVWWWVIPGLVAVIGLAIALSGLGWMFRGRPFKGGRGVFGGGLFLAVGAVIALMGLNIQTYHRLGEARQHIATIEFGAANADGQRALTVVEHRQGEPDETRSFQDVRGDRWLMIARVIRWKPWAVVLGLDAQYRLESLDGTWRDQDVRRTTLPTVVDLRPERRTGLDFLPAATFVSQYLPFLEVAEPRQPGEAICWPIADGARYKIWITAEGDLRAEPEGDAAVDAINELGAAAC